MGEFQVVLKCLLLSSNPEKSCIPAHFSYYGKTEIFFGLARTRLPVAWNLNKKKFY